MQRLLSRFLDNCLTAACIPLVILVLLTTSDVFARYALASSVPDTIELSGLMLGLMVSLALAPVTFSKRQVGIEFIMSVFPIVIQRVIRSLLLLFAASIFGLMAWQAGLRTIKSHSIGEFVGSLQVQLWPLKALFTFGVIVTCVALVWMAKQAWSDRSPPPGVSPEQDAGEV